MKKIHLLLSALLLIVFVACGDDSNEYNIGGRKGGDTPVQPDDRQSAGPEIAKYNLEFPALKGGKSIVIVHQGVLNDKLKKSGVNYSVEWDTEIRSQRWSCYQMYADNYKTGSQVSRYKTENSSLSSNGQYPNNPELPTQYQFTSDPYWGTGYDHGHICPSADRQRANEANYQTFFMTNMQPQCGTKSTWAGNFDTLFVCKGGTIDKAEHIIEYIGSGNNRIPVPKYFFMAVLGKKGTSFKATGFWIAQDDHKSSSIKSYAVTIQALQNNTGIDFFCNLPDDIENQVENVAHSQMEKEWVWQQ